jgi:phospholipid-binding lipoprotein MlaA
MTRLLASLLLLLLAACQSVPVDPDAAPEGERAVFEYEDFERRDVLYAIDVYDPIEPLNRGIYKFNAIFDRLVFLPVTELYEFVTPTFVQDRVSDFFSNLTEINTFTNSILQAKFERASRALVRFVVNSTIGLAGLFDPMAALGSRQEREDLGQTFGTWGLPAGPYIVLPILGPSNLRDTLGLAGDTAAYQAADPLGLSSFESDHPEILALRAVDQRHMIGLRYYQTGSPFEYDLTVPQPGHEAHVVVIWLKPAYKLGFLCAEIPEVQDERRGLRHLIGHAEGELKREHGIVPRL